MTEIKNKDTLSDQLWSSKSKATTSTEYRLCLSRCIQIRELNFPNIILFSQLKPTTDNFALIFAFQQIAAVSTNFLFWFFKPNLILDPSHPRSGISNLF